MMASLARLLGTSGYLKIGPWPMPPAGGLLLFYAACLAGAGLGQALRIIPDVSITFWPPAGIFAGTLLAMPRATWPWFVVAAGLAELTGNIVWFQNPISFALLYFMANAMVAVAAAAMVQSVAGRRFRMETLREVAAFVVLAAGLAPMISASVIAATDVLRGKHAFMTAWTLVWLGDGSGLLAIAPLTVVAVWLWRDRSKIVQSRAIEAMALVALLVSIIVIEFRGGFPTPYIALPPLLWIALRFQLQGAAAALTIIVIATTWLTVMGKGGFAGSPAQAKERIIELKTFLAICAVSSLVTAALSRQLVDAIAALRTANGELEGRVEARTAELVLSERRLSAVLDALPIGVGLVGADGQAIVGNEAFRRLTSGAIPSRDPRSAGDWEGTDAQGARIAPEDFPGARALRGERVWPGQAFLYHGDAARGPRWMRVAALPFADSDGQAAGATVVIDDIDEETRALAALRRSEASLRLAQEAASLGAWDHDLIEGTAQWSDEARRLLDVAPDQQPSTALWLSRIHPADRAQVQAALDEALRPETDGRYGAQYRIPLPDGSVRWLEAQGRIERAAASGMAIRAHGVVRDVSERVAHEHQRELLTQEINHRSKNMLSLVQAIARQTAAGDPAEFLNRFEQRVQALAASQDLLISNGFTGVELGDLVRAQLSHFADLWGARIEAAGPPVSLGAPAAQAIGLALHELATNAVKYGALSNNSGRVSIAWAWTGEAPGRSFEISWEERGGPRVAPPTRKGFGTRVISQLSRLALEAEIVFDLKAEGLTWQLRCDADRLSKSGSPAPFA